MNPNLLRFDLCFCFSLRIWLVYMVLVFPVPQKSELTINCHNFQFGELIFLITINDHYLWSNCDFLDVTFANLQFLDIHLQRKKYVTSWFFFSLYDIHDFFFMQKLCHFMSFSWKLNTFTQFCLNLILFKFEKLVM